MYAVGQSGGVMTADMYNMESLPVLVEHLHFKAGQTVQDVACGERHTIVVTSKYLYMLR